MSKYHLTSKHAYCLFREMPLTIPFLTK